MNYFQNVTNLQELKKEYRKLAKQYHPDINKNDTTNIMKEVNKQYKQLFETLKNSTNNNNQNENTEKAETYPNIINELIKYENINIDIVGSWLWISGDTYPIKDKLKEIGFKWSKNKKKWYYASTISKKKKKGTMSYNQIINKYGKQTIKSEGKKAIG